MAPSTSPPPRPSDEVNLFIGTDAGQPDFGTGGGAGNTYPGAVRPFGMLAWSPDTHPSTVNFAGGYTYSDVQLEGFSLTHLSGPGCPVFQDVPILPISVPVSASPASAVSSTVAPVYTTTFSHDHEEAVPGSYSVVLNPGSDREIAVQLTADVRSGLGQLDFATGTDAGVLVNATGSAMAASAADVHVDPESRLVTGSVESGRFCFSDSRYRLYFAIRFDRDFASFGTWHKQDLHPGSTEASDVADLPLTYSPIPGGPSLFPGDPTGTAQTGAYVGFDTGDDHRVRMKVGISYVDGEGALRNLDAEQRTWKVAKAAQRARRSWDKVLRRVEIDGVSPDRRRIFSTALYHCFLAPSVFSDIDGRYTGMDGKVRTSRRTHYANFSGWDVYRTQMPLLAMLHPKRASEIAQSLVDQAKQAGWMPKWSYANANTQTMNGDPALPTLATVHALGARDFKAKKAVKLGERGATDPSQLGGPYVVRPGVRSYTSLGYVTSDEDGLGPAPGMLEPGTVWGAAATTLEYAVADYALSRLAKAVGNHEVADSALARSRSWRNLFNPDTGFIEPRSADGSFRDDYDVAAGEGFVEGNSAQYTWCVPHDVGGLVELMGGRQPAAERLDEFFSRLNAGPKEPYAYLGNEPSLGTPWLYAWLGQPATTQDILRRALPALFKDEPGGLPGNDDLGTMSAWYVLATLGLYPAIPGTDVLVVTTPQVPKAVLHLPKGDVRLKAPDVVGKPYVEELRIDGEWHGETWLRFKQIRKGATLTFTTAQRPTSWGTRPEDAPPSAGR